MGGNVKKKPPCGNPVNRRSRACVTCNPAARRRAFPGRQRMEPLIFTDNCRVVCTWHPDKIIGKASCPGYNAPENMRWAILYACRELSPLRSKMKQYRKPVSQTGILQILPPEMRKLQNDKNDWA